MSQPLKVIIRQEFVKGRSETFKVCICMKDFFVQITFVTIMLLN